MSSQQSQASELPPPVTYTIGGVTVEFPTKAYPSQIAMMNKVIQGLKQKQNCLLESPTGSGKSLALLCASLAWQRHEAARIAKHNAAIDERLLQQELEQEKNEKKPTTIQESEIRKSGVNMTDRLEKGKDVWVKGNGGGATAQFVVDLTDDDDDFQPPKRVKQSSTPTKNSEETEPALMSFEQPNAMIIELDKPNPSVEDPCCPLADKRLVVPKIYFGTRTHKQIAQITRELRKTIYKQARIAILASRDHTCVNPMVERLPNKNEACKELLDNVHVEGGGCGWQLQAKKFGNYANLPSYGVAPGYDLEAFVTAGRRAKACPFYATRNLISSADIIFCPYNYLVETTIRKSMSIELSGQVVIFDEAHNMEDCAREAASIKLNQDEIQLAMQDCEKVGVAGTETYAHAELANFLSAISTWMDSESRNLAELDFSTEGKHWNGTEFTAFMMNLGVMEKINMYKEHFHLISEQRATEMDLQRDRGKTSRFGPLKPMITSATTYILEAIFQIFEQFNRENGKYRDDFRVAILRSSVRKRGSRFGSSTSKLMMSLNIWCLNPAVPFGDLKSLVHCIILTSGTLSPIQSFQSELGTPFPIKLEASHVIDRTQIWASVIAAGPTNKNLNGSYQNASTSVYHDELGELIARICRLIPHGVLCFFPSYRLLETVTERWRDTNSWNEIGKIKDIYVEPRTGNADFQETISSFYASIQDTNSGPRGFITGAIFLAVCRGKVSEGLDFADNNARAVICIGIPFPNYRDPQVILKREYNDRNRNRGLLPGGEWYEIQAFRALNQALGRCIRHRFDWGAIFLVDERFQKSPKYVESLSKWVRSSVQPYHSWLKTENQLVEFRDHMLATLPQQAVGQFRTEFTDTGVDSNPGAFFGNNETPSSSPKFGFPPGYSDAFSSTGVINTGMSRIPLDVNNSKNQMQSPYFVFGNTKTPTRLFSIFAGHKQKNTKKSAIVFDDEGS